VPSNFTVSVGDASADLLWDLVNSAQSYRVEWLSDPKTLAVSNGTASHGSLTNSLRYVYSVTIGTQKVFISAVPVAADLSAPATISITPGLRDNTLSWSPVPNAAAYRVYWSYTPNVSPATGTRIDVDGSQTTHVHTDLDPGVHYYYVVTALVSSTTGLPSAEVGAQPGQALAVTVSVSDSRVDLNWANTAGASIEVSTSRTFDVPFFPFPVRNGVPVPVHVDGLENGTRYAFRVRPVFAEGPGPASTTVYATPSPVAPDVPEWVKLTAGRGVNTLVWDPIDNASDYEVSWTAIAAGGLIASGTNTVDEPRFRHSGLQGCLALGAACPTYTYLVRVPSSGQIAPVVQALSVDLRPVSPLITNATSIILTGVKPQGSRIEINGDEVVPFDHETGWTATVQLDSDATFIFRLVAINEDGLASIETTYQVTRDTVPPTNSTVSIEACDPVTASPRQITLSGTKDSGSAVFRKMEPSAPDQQISGATASVNWSGVLDVEDQVFELIAKDAAGNASSPVVVDLSDPTAGCP
jgi:hypothetical protein